MQTLHAHDHELPDWLARVRALERQGEYFRAYDLASQAIQRWPGDERLKHRAVLALCNAGATDLALQRFAALGLDSSLDVDCLALHARIHKSIALAASGPARQEALLRSAQHYRAAWSRACATDPDKAYFPAINLATTLFLADPASAESRVIAAEVAAGLASRLNGTIPDYWLWATAVEAAILLRDDAQLDAWLPGAVSAGRDLPDARASTVRQLRVILAQQDRDAALIAPLVPGPFLHFTGLLPHTDARGRGLREMDHAAATEAIDAFLEAQAPSGAFGALAAGADLLVAEALIRRRIPLHVVLPFRTDDFVALSVAPFGGAWVDRFERCLAAATSIRQATTEAYLGDDCLFAHASQVAMGLASLSARQWSTRAIQLAIWDGHEHPGDAGTAADLRQWATAGLPHHVLRVPGAAARADAATAPAAATDDATPHRQTRAMLFADVKGFSRLEEWQIPVFHAVVLSELGRVVARHGGDILFANTWGDGLFLVFAEAAAAARVAQHLQRAMAAIPMVEHGLPASLTLRIGVHLGPAYCLPDPILARPNFFGTEVSRAARIEPVTPERCIYVTEPVAASLALTHPDQFDCDYVGMTEAAKGHGALRMFLLRDNPGR